jgi:hypothetical protein
MRSVLILTRVQFRLPLSTDAFVQISAVATTNSESASHLATAYQLPSPNLPSPCELGTNDG